MLSSSSQELSPLPLRLICQGGTGVAGAPARLVHHQLSAHLLKALERQLQQLPPDAAPAVLPGQQMQGTLVQQGWTLASMHLQALGLGAVTAEVQEGRPGEATWRLCWHVWFHVARIK